MLNSRNGMTSSGGMNGPRRRRNPAAVAGGTITVSLI
jgi:hypothetical protein